MKNLETLKYKCLILDHDDTAVHSTADIHYPAHLIIMEQLRPDHEVISLDEWFLKNFHPGIMEYMKNELKFTEEEIKIEYGIWQDYVKSRHPRFYPGFLEIIREFKNRGGRVAVVSHSNAEVIKRDYKMAGASDIPEMIFGWDIDETKRKPAPFPVEEILKEFNLESKDALIIDDLKPAVIMGERTGVHVAGAGWGHQIPEIVNYMKENCNYYFQELEEFKKLILG